LRKIFFLFFRKFENGCAVLLTRGGSHTETILTFSKKMYVPELSSVASSLGSIAVAYYGLPLISSPASDATSDVMPYLMSGTSQTVTTIETTTDRNPSTSDLHVIYRGKTKVFFAK